MDEINKINKINEINEKIADYINSLSIIEKKALEIAKQIIGELDGPSKET